jgi:hypothetical protein
MLPKTAALIAVLAPASQAWDGAGHEVITRAAVAILPDDMPAFLRTAGAQIAHVAVDPDIAKHRSVPAARESEYPEHFIDLELLDGHELPTSRFAFVKLCCSLGVGPEKVGMLPYAVAEWTERFAVALAEYRAWPKNAMIQHKALVYAGFAAHYAQDLCQPLHTTVHYDGRVGEDGVSPRSGIHRKVDALVENAGAKPRIIAKGTAPAAVDSLLPFILNELAVSHALVDTMYAMEDIIPSVKGTKLMGNVAICAGERFRRAAAVTAGLYRYAWLLSADIQLQDRLER